MRVVPFNPYSELNCDHDNTSKHHLTLTLTEAQLVFEDHYRIEEEYDPNHSDTEPRYYAIGILPSGKIIKANYTMRGDAYRLITAREVTREEKRMYAQHLRDILGL